MPDLGPVDYIAVYWEKAGQCESGFSGPAPLSSNELDCWARRMFIRLTPYEFECLRDMSRAYCSQLHLAASPECPPPFGHWFDYFDRALISQRVAEAFGRVGNKKKQST